MTNENLNKAKLDLQELISETDNPDLLKSLKTILCNVNAIPDDIAQTIIKYENYNDREALLATITKLNEQNHHLLSEREDLKNTIDELEKDNYGKVRELHDKIKDLTEINLLSKKLIKILEDS